MITARHQLTALWVTLILAGATLLVLTVLGPDWATFTPASCTATRCFCELSRTGALVLQPANSWSSFGYVFVGILMIVASRGPAWRSGLTPDAAAFLGLTGIFVGVGSALLHATLTLWGQFFDVAGMYFTSGFMLVYALNRIGNWSSQRTASTYLLLLGALLALLYFQPEVRRWLFTVVLVAAIGAELALARPRRREVRTSYYLAGMAIQTLAFAIWNLDQQGLVCQPTSLLQGHAAWHLLGAGALWLTFRYYASEQPVAHGS